MNQYQIPQGFHLADKLILLAIFNTTLLSLAKLFIANQVSQAFQDIITIPLLAMIYHQKNFCLALLTIIYLCYGFFMSTLIIIGMIQYDIKFIDSQDAFTLKASKILIVCSSFFQILHVFILHKAYKEYKGVVYDIKQLEYTQQQQQQQPNSDDNSQDQ